jgi:hypothetical protein
LQERKRQAGNEQLIARPCRKSYGLPCGDKVGEVAGVAGVALASGKTPAPQSGAEEETGEGFAAIGAGEVWGAACVFISSRRNALSAVLLWA